MKHFFSIFIAVAVVTAVSIGPVIPPARAVESFAYRPGEVLVKLKDSESLIRVRLDEALDVKRVAEEYLDFEAVARAEPNVIYRVSAFPSDPELGQQWYLNAINVREAWSRELVVRELRPIQREAVIAIIDTGVDLAHPDLKNNVWVNPNEIAGDGIDNDHNGFVDDVNGWDFVSDSSNPTPRLEGGFVKEAVNHGTIVAGIAAASGHNLEGMAGVAWRAKIMSLRALDSRGDGDAFDVYNAINYAIRNKADVINMSFVGDENSTILNDVIRRAYDAGIVVVAAAGNSDPSAPGIDFGKTKVYPVCADAGGELNYVVGVAAVDRAQQRSRFTNYGNNCIDLAAPGEDFFSTLTGYSGQTQFSSPYGGFFSGTSLSAPLVSGAVAMLKTVRPDLSSPQLIAALLEGVKKNDAFSSQGLGKGMLDVYQALTLAEKSRSGSGTGTGQLSPYLVVGLGFGSFPQIKIYKSDDTVFKSFFAYSPTFPGPVHLAVGDTDGDGKQDIITGAGPRGGPHVRIFDIEGRVKAQFFAYDQKTRYGVNIAACDVDGNGISEIIVAQGRGGSPEVKIFSGAGVLMKSFMAYAASFKGGVNIACGDTTGDGLGEIVTGAGAGGGPHVRIFDGQGSVIGQFFAYNPQSRSGMRVALGDINNDVFDEIIVVPESGVSALVRVIRPNGFGTISEFLAFSPDSTRGAYLSVGDLDDDGKNEIIAGLGEGGGAQIRVFDWQGVKKKELLAHPDFYKGGVRPAVLEQ